MVPIPRGPASWFNAGNMARTLLSVAIVGRRRVHPQGAEAPAPRREPEAEAFESGRRSWIRWRAAPDCVILDLHMPGMTGLHVLQRLKQAGVQLPAIVITAYDEALDPQPCLAAGGRRLPAQALEDRLLLDAVAAAA